MHIYCMLQNCQGLCLCVPSGGSRLRLGCREPSPRAVSNQRFDRMSDLRIFRKPLESNFVSLVQAKFASSWNFGQKILCTKTWTILCTKPMITERYLTVFILFFEMPGAHRPLQFYIKIIK